MENWKRIVDYDYEISDLGNIRSLDRYSKRTAQTTRKLKGRKLKPFPVNGGYLCVYLCNQKGKKSFKVHRLVALYFIPNPDSKKEVNHRDGVRTNNIALNLEWNTRSENNIHSYLVLNRKHGMKGKRGSLCPLSKKINQYTKEGVFIRTWDSSMDIQRTLGIGNSNVIKCCNGKFKTMGGYKWKHYSKSNNK